MSQLECIPTIIEMIAELPMKELTTYVEQVAEELCQFQLSYVDDPVGYQDAVWSGQLTMAKLQQSIVNKMLEIRHLIDEGALHG